MDITFQVPMQCRSLQHQILLLSPETFTLEHWFRFDPATSFFLELFVIARHSSPVAYWTPSYLGELIFWCHIFLPFHTVHRVLQARILEWVANHSSCGPRFVRTLQYDLSVGWPCMAWLIDSMSYASPRPTTRLWSMKGFIVCHLVNSYHRMPFPM